MEKLSHIINQKIGKGTWKTLRVSRGGPEISHLFFVDDLILFGQATNHQAELMKSCIDLFCDVSGQQVNFDKFRIFCFPNVITDLANDIVVICETPLYKNLGKYLGVPLIHGRVNSHTYKEIIDKTQN
ncbi:hypothetical protein ACOSP7_006999 [Xanthoceras sorbifolium]